MPQFTVEAKLSQSSGRRRTVGLLSITPSDPSLTLTYWQPGEEERALYYRHPQPILTLDGVEGMTFHCSAWQHERRVAKFSVYLDWRGVQCERAWHAKVTVNQEHPLKDQILNLPW